jgi:hypothetical protein
MIDGTAAGALASALSWAATLAHAAVDAVGGVTCLGWTLWFLADLIRPAPRPKPAPVPSPTARRRGR